VQIFLDRKFAQLKVPYYCKTAASNESYTKRATIKTYTAYNKATRRYYRDWKLFGHTYTPYLQSDIFVEMEGFEPSSKRGTNELSTCVVSV